MAPIVKTLPLYIKGINHAGKKFRGFIFFSAKATHFHYDTTSFYTVVPKKEGFQTLRYFFDQRTINEPSLETLLCLAELVNVLTLNCY